MSPEQEARAQRLADAGLMAMTVIWAVNFSIAKLALQDIEPLAFNALRFPFAALTVLVVLRMRGPLPAPRREDWGRLVALAFLGNVVYQLLFIYGLDRTRAGNASLLLTASPIMTALLSSAVGHESVSRRVWVAVFTTVAGIALVAGQGDDLALGGQNLAGDLMLVAASLSWAVYTVSARPLVERYGSVEVTAWTLWLGTAALILLGAPALARTDFARVSSLAWLAVLYAGALSIGVAYLLWYNGVRRVGNTRTAVYSNLVPVLALAVAWWWLGETPTARQLLGAAVIIGGVTLARLDPGARLRRLRRGKAAPPPPAGAP